MRPNRVLRSGLLPFLLTLTFYCLAGGSGMAASRNFWIDSRTGDDTQDGTSPRRAWRTLERLSRCSLQPGDVVLFLGAGDIYYAAQYLLKELNK